MDYMLMNKHGLGALLPELDLTEYPNINLFRVGYLVNLNNIATVRSGATEHAGAVIYNNEELDSTIKTGEKTMLTDTERLDEHRDILEGLQRDAVNLNREIKYAINDLKEGSNLATNVKEVKDWVGVVANQFNSIENNITAK